MPLVCIGFNPVDTPYFLDIPMPAFATPVLTTRMLRWLALAAALPGLGALSGCFTTALIVASQIDVPPACSSLSTVEQALTPRCGGYKAGMLVTKDVNTPIQSDCPLTKFASDSRTWQGLPELLAKGAKPEHCNQAPLVAMAQHNACPDFAAMSPQTLGAVRWLALGDGQSVSAPVLGMLSCPSARQAGLSDVITTWVAQQTLAPGNLRFSPLSALHPSSLREPWVALLIGLGHKPHLAADQDTRGFELALQSGDVPALQWWVQHAPKLIQRAPAKGVGYIPWLPLARVMTPGFAVDDAARSRSVDFLLARGANPHASLPHDRTQTVLTYTRRVQPQLAQQLANAAPASVTVAASVRNLSDSAAAMANLD